MATATWPLEKLPEMSNQKHSDRFGTFSLVFNGFGTSSLVFALFGLSVSGLFDRPFSQLFVLLACCHSLRFSSKIYLEALTFTFLEILGLSGYHQHPNFLARW